MELSNSIQIPQIGLGVYKMEAQRNGASRRLPLFDTAQMYRNEAAFWHALSSIRFRAMKFFLSVKWIIQPVVQPTLDSLQESLKNCRPPISIPF